MRGAYIPRWQVPLIVYLGKGELAEFKDNHEIIT